MNATAARTRPVRVVIVDDTYDLRELLRLALTRGGMEVVGEAGDGLAGIEAVRLERPDVVLLDLSMPVMDGLEALPSIRRLVPRGQDHRALRLRRHPDVRARAGHRCRRLPAEGDVAQADPRVRPTASWRAPTTR